MERSEEGTEASSKGLRNVKCGSATRALEQIAGMRRWPLESWRTSTSTAFVRGTVKSLLVSSVRVRSSGNSTVTRTQSKRATKACTRILPEEFVNVTFRDLRALKTTARDSLAIESYGYFAQGVAACCGGEAGVSVAGTIESEQGDKD